MDVMRSPTGHYSVQRRVAGYHDLRLDGISDLLNRAKGCSVLDIGCNRGAVGFQFYENGASAVHGCDIYEAGIMAAREWFADLRAVESQFEVVDLTKGSAAFKRFRASYDIVLLLATYHKLKRVMPADELSKLIQHVGRMTKGYFGWRATSEQLAENDAEIAALDRDLREVNLHRIHTSYISTELGVAAIWARG
jgi:SAM-dependent methyltransferase